MLSPSAALSPTALMWTQIAAGIFVFLAVNVAYGIWLQTKKMHGASRWPVVPGEILVSQVEIARTHRSDDQSDSCGPSCTCRA